MTESCYKIIITILGVLTVIFLILGGAGPSIMQKVLDDKIEDGLVLEEKNAEKWASMPGEVGVFMKRDFIFFDFLNHEDVLYRGQQPQFKESKIFSFQEINDYMDREYVDDGKVVKFNEYQRYDRHKGSNFTGDEDIKFMNLAPLASWESMKKSPAPSIALRVLSNLFIGLDKDLINQVVSQGIGANVLSNFNFTVTKQVLSSFNIPSIKDIQLDALSADPVNGWTQNGLKVWIDSIFDALNGTIQPKKPLNNEQLELQDYFGLNSDQLNAILDRLYLISSQTYQAAFTNGFCQHPLLSSLNCTNKSSSTAQWTSALFTNPKSMVSSGYVELSLYYKNVFSNMQEENIYKVSNDSIFNVQFSMEWGEKVMRYLQDPEYIKEPQALLNIGNLANLYKEGQLLDLEIQQNQISVYQNSSHLANIMEQFQLQSKEHTFVFWNYMKYLVSELGNQSSLGGDTESTSAGSLSKAGIENSFQGLQKFLLPSLTAIMVQGALQQQNISCEVVFQNIGITDNATLQGVCSQLDFTKLQTYQLINAVCYQQSVEAINSFTFLNQAEINQLCSTSSIYGSTLNGVSSKIKTHYNCQDISDRCTMYEIAAKQWSKGEITLNPIAEIASVFPSQPSVQSWFPQFFKFPIEYHAISEKFKDIFQNQQLFYPTDSQLRQWLSPQKLFNSQLVGLAYNWNKAQQINLITAQLFTNNPQQLIQYFRYVAVEGTLGGFLTVQKIEKTLYGYEDPFLKRISQGNPQTGGNPAVSSIFSLSSNSTKEERFNYPKELYTGKGDADKYKKIKSIYGVSDYITKRSKIFDGYEVKTVNINPWEDEVPYKGTGGSNSNPDQEEGQTTYVHVTSLLFGAKLPQIKQTEINGLDCYRYEIDRKVLANKTENPKNQGQYFDGPTGLLNLTKAMSSPMFISGPHFNLADQQLKDNVTIYNKDGNVQGSSEWDSTFVEVEEHTGTTFSVALRQQINYQIKPDLLFPLQFTRYLPVYYLDRGMNLTSQQIDDEFGTLKDVLNAKTYMYIFGFTLAFVCMVSIYVVYRIQKIQNLKAEKEKKSKYEKQQNLESLASQP